MAHSNAIHSVILFFSQVNVFAHSKRLTEKKALKFITRARATYHHVIIITQAETFILHTKNAIQLTEEHERAPRMKKIHAKKDKNKRINAHTRTQQ